MSINVGHLLRRIRRGRSLIGRSFIGMAMVGALASAGLAQPQIAHAETVAYEFTGSWENAPATVKSGGDTLSAVWRFDINDNSPAPSNSPVPNNIVTFTAQNATFSSIPTVCLTSGVTPVSSLSADRKTLVCNIGTRDQGTAQVSFTGLIPNGNTGDQVTVSGTYRDKTVELPKIPIVNPFVMDAKFNGGTVGTASGVDQLVEFGWSLSHSTGSTPGPSTVSYDLTLTPSNNEAVSLDGTGCSPITTAFAGYPFSDTTHAPEQTAPFPTCLLTPLGGNKFRLTLSNLNYTAPAPTLDGRGQGLPPGMDVIAAGRVTFKFPYVSNGTLSLSATTPTYVAAGAPGTTSTDAASNNTNSVAYLRGGWTHGFVQVGPLSGGSAWTDTYRAFAGDLVYSNISTQGVVGNANCLILDTKYVTFDSAKVSNFSNTPAFSGATYWYYTGTAGGLLDPSSASYDPNAWTGCNTTNPPGAGWTNVAPANPANVKAVLVFTTQGLINQATNANAAIRLYVSQTIKSGVAAGQDIWSWGSFRSNGNWFHPARSLNPADVPGAATLTPGTRYPFAAGGRDNLRVISSSPTVVKEVAQREAGPGATVDYTLRYGLTAPVASGPTGQVVLVDTLPAGMTYVVGSANPAPVISGSPATGQTLTWTLNNIQVNKNPLDVLNFKATVPASAAPGATFTNTVTASSQGRTATASAQFLVPRGGYTTLVKTAAAAEVVPTNGVAEGSWTVRMTSADPVSSATTDTVDILPYLGDGRGTTFSGTYKLKQAVQAVAGATVYYTTAPPGSLNEDPKDPSNGGFGTTTGNTVGWTATYTENATAVRVIGPALAFGQSQDFTVRVVTSGSLGGDTFVNTAVGRASDTQLRMRTSDQFKVQEIPSFVLKKYVRDSSGNWHDAQDPNDFPAYNVGDTARYRLVVQNTGNIDLENLPLTDTKADLGQLFQDGNLTSNVTLQGSAVAGVSINLLTPNQTATIEYDLVINEAAVENNTLLNTACVNPEPGNQMGLEPSCDPAGVKVFSSLAWEKISAYSATTFLNGSEWELIQVSGDGGNPLTGATAIAVIDCVAAQAADCAGRDIDPQAGRFKVVSLEAGWYRLTETKSPVGYKLDTTPRYLEVSGVYKIDQGIVNELTDVPTIPLTGGMGAFAFWAAGGFGALFASAGLLWQRRRTLKV